MYNFTFKSKDIVLPLCRSMVRLHLEYAVQFWDPQLRKYIRKLYAGISGNEYIFSIKASLQGKGKASIT